ncbi:hypothetical protein JRF84_08045 [Methylobacterium organophilum]|uniref:hypothetical protein n=1 Tax=Methylobacterium organophilum TaxID=410 RepID=UPI0019D0ABAC|nr:hypothetical protein [Methylobacterium organophilum]MBN6819539.1 hypothetical protein [Methylobacterium organophilum]
MSNSFASRFETVGAELDHLVRTLPHDALTSHRDLLELWERVMARPHPPTLADQGGLYGSLRDCVAYLTARLPDAPAMVPQQVQQQQDRDMRAGPDVMRATAQAFQDADEAWGEALRREFGRRAAEARYSPAGKGDVGSVLRALYCARYAAYSAWCEARCMPVMPDPACSAVTVKPSCDRVSA